MQVYLVGFDRFLPIDAKQVKIALEWLDGLEDWFAEKCPNMVAVTIYHLMLAGF